jgi:hypothetical protein
LLVRTGISHPHFLQARGTLDRREPYFDIEQVFQTFGTCQEEDGCGPKLSQWSRKTLEMNAATLLHADFSARAGESSKLVRYRLRISARSGLSGLLWDTKENPGRFTPVKAAHCHEEYCAEWCSPCVVAELLKRTSCFQLANDIDCNPQLKEKTSGLFLWTYHKNGKHPSLGSNAVSNLIQKALRRANVPKEWTAHKLRGLTPSKAINLGWPWLAALLRGRWSPSSQTFEKSYFRRTLYKETSPDNAKLSFEVVIRLKETRLV